MRARATSLGSVVLLALLLWLLVEGPRQEEERERDEAEPVPSSAAHAEVLRVVDGDTIEVEIDGREEDVRYIGVDTPETVAPGKPVGCFGPEASARNHELVEGEDVRLVFGAEVRDDYGRLLAYVHAGGRLVNAELLRGGYARTLEIPPNTAMATEFRGIERRAATAGRGLWGTC